MHHSSPKPVPSEPRRRRGAASRFRSNTKGATVVEYALIASVMAAALMACLPLFSASTGNLYNRIANAMNAS